MRWAIKKQGFSSQWGKRFFSSLQCPVSGTVAHSASYPMSITGYTSPGIKEPGCEVDHSPPSSTKVKNAQMHGAIPTLPYASSWHDATS
jgi:hypothetical protein